MATIALAAAGSSFTGGATATIFGAEFLYGQAIGATIGSIIDSYILMPALFPQEEPAAPQLDGIQIGGAQEGASIWRVAGAQSRIPGTWTYISDLTKHPDTLGGGKGGSNDGVTVYDYSVHAVCSFCQTHIAGYEKIFMDGQLVYQDPAVGVVELTDTELSMSVIAGAPTKVYLESSTLGPDLTDSFFHGLDIVISGFTDSNNNGTFKVLGGASFSEGNSRLEIELVTQVTEAKGDTVTVSQASQGWLPFIVNDTTFYTGNGTQSPDSFLEGIHGVGKVPAFKNMAYIVFDTLWLERFGNRAPVVEAVVRVQSMPTIEDVIDDIMAWADFTDYSVDTSLVLTDAYGYKYQGPTSAATMLTPLMVAHNVAVRETDGTLEFYKREDADEVTVPSEDYSCSREGSRASALPFLTTPTDPKELPSQVKVTFSNTEFDYQAGERAYALDESESDETLTIDLGMVATTPDVARQVAMKSVNAAWVNSLKIQDLVLPGSYFYLQEGDILNITVWGGERKIFIQTLDQSPNGTITVRGFIEETQMFGISYLGGSSTPPSTKPPLIGVTASHVIPCRPLAWEDDAGSLGNQWWMYQAVGAQNGIYQGGSTWEDDGSGYEMVAGNRSEQIIGYATSALADCVDPLVWDYVSTVTVYLYSGELESSTKDNVAAFKNNIAVIGHPPYHEVIGFVNATLVDTNTYELSTLLRGMRGTEGATDDHVINEPFSIGWTKVPVGPTAVEKDYKVLGLGDELGDTTAKEFTLANDFTHGVHSQGFRSAMTVTHGGGSRDGSNNITVSWTPRHQNLTRTFFDDPSLPWPPLFWVQLMPEAGGPNHTKLLQKIVGTPFEVVFTAAEITAAGNTPANPQKFLVSATGGGQEDLDLSQSTFDPSRCTFIEITI